MATGAADTSKNITMSGGNDHAFHLWTDGVHIWVHDQLDKKIYVYNLETKLQVSNKNIDLDSSKGTYKGIWSDGTTMWVTEATTPDTAYAYTLDGGARDSTKDITLDSLNTNGIGIWSDGITVWVSDTGANKLFAYHTTAP